MMIMIMRINDDNEDYYEQKNIKASSIEEGDMTVVMMSLVMMIMTIKVKIMAILITVYSKYENKDVIMMTTMIILSKI